MKKVFKITTNKDYLVTRDDVPLRTISKYDDILKFSYSEKEAKDEFKWEIFVKRWPKCFNIEEITPPSDGKLHTLRGNECMVYVFLNGKQVFTWSDHSNIDWPEDLTWDREIGAVFDLGVEIGKKLVD